MTGHENAYEGPFDLSITNLVQGDNVLSAEVHQSGGGSSDMVFGAELIATVPIIPVVTNVIAINDTTTWRYDRTGRDLGTDWRAKNYDDSTWPQGKTLIADEGTTTVEPIRTPISRFNDNMEYVRTFYFRTHFNFPATSTAGAKLRLRHVVDDGAIFYLNGVEVQRFGVAANPVDYLSDASGHENAYEGPFDLSITNLVTGDNVLAAEVHQSGGGSSDMVFGAELILTYLGGGGGTPPAEQPKFTKISQSGTTVVIEWTGGGTLQSADALSGQWTNVAGSPASPHTVTPSVPTRYFRITK